jgi:ATP-dependent helicase/nuclease subunit A
MNSEADGIDVVALDQRARERALDATQSILLQAPAGSGKTTVLTARYLALLGVVHSPEEILAVTFTRKAAAEMRHRVIQALQNYGTADESGAGIAPAILAAALERDRLCRWDLQRNPSRLRIETIDALNYRLASQLPIAARASPGLRITTDPGSLYRRAARHCLEQAEHDPDIAAAANFVFERLDNNWSRIEGRLADMLQQRSHWLPRVLVTDDNDALVARIEESLVATLRVELAAAIVPLPTPLLHESERLLTYSLNTRRLPLPQGGVRLNAEPGSIASWRALTGLALKGDGDWRRSFTKTDGFPSDDAAAKAMKARAIAWRDTLERTAGAREALSQVALLPDAQLNEEDRAALAALSLLLMRAAAELQLVFAASGAVDFSYVSGAARAALTEKGDPSDLALRTGAAIQHILIDEFQDTSYEQLDLLRALTAGWQRGDGRTLFVVGDPMQSIYQFREAEVGLFLQARDHGIAELPLQELQLRRNFRSRAAVIDWVNEKFGQLFPRTDNARLAAIRYLPSLPGALPQQDAAATPVPAATLHGFADGDLVAEAAAVVGIVARSVKPTRRQRLPCWLPPANTSSTSSRNSPPPGLPSVESISSR